MITRYKELYVLELTNITLSEITDILHAIGTIDIWLYFILKETDHAIIGFPANFSNVYTFMSEQEIWGLDYYPDFTLSIFFNSEEDAIQCKLTNLLDL